VWAQQLGIALQGWRWHRRRFSPHFHALAAELRAREWWDEARFERYQHDRLRAVLRASLKAPYYRAAFDGLDIDRAGSVVELLGRLPVLTRETLRSRPEDLLTGDPGGGVHTFTTSGSSGMPARIYYTPEFHAFELAIAEARSLNWAGLTYRDRRVMFGARKVCPFEQSRPPFWRHSPAENMAYASLYHLSDRFLPAYVDFLHEYRPRVIMGYPRSLARLARYSLETGHLPPPARAVFTMSEAVGASTRQVLEAAWGCRVFDRYGAVENCVFASQCEYGRYHVSPEAGIVEILDPAGRPCPPGQTGEVVCTGLVNTLQPLVRYRIGDLARWSTETVCPCGRAMPLIDGIEGRFDDLCYTRDGREILPDVVFNGIATVAEGQTVQEEIDRFLILVVPAPGFGAGDRERLEHALRALVGPVLIRIDTVSEIPREPSGKIKSVKCLLPNDVKNRLRSNATARRVRARLALRVPGGMARDRQPA
jgi:phenylacetate-CoA ligase